MYRNIILTLLLAAAIIIAIEMRPRAVAMRSEPVLSTADEQYLDRKIPNLILRQATVRQAIEEIHKATGVEFSVDWLSIPGWDHEVLNMELHDVTIGDALDYLFQTTRRSYSGTVEQVNFEVADGTVRIAESTRVKQTMTLRIYDVRDLLTDEFWGCQSGPNPMDEQASRLRSLASIIEYFAGPRDWDMELHRGRGGGGAEPLGCGTIQAEIGRLFVRQTARGHRQVEAALERLRQGGIPPAARKHS